MDSVILSFILSKSFKNIAQRREPAPKHHVFVTPTTFVSILCIFRSVCSTYRLYGLWKIAYLKCSFNICRMDEKHKYGHFYYGKIRKKFRKKVQTRKHLALGHCTRNGVWWIRVWRRHGSQREKLYKLLQKLVTQRCRIPCYRFSQIPMSKVIVFFFFLRNKNS